MKKIELESETETRNLISKDYSARFYCMLLKTVNEMVRQNDLLRIRQSKKKNRNLKQNLKRKNIKP